MAASTYDTTQDQSTPPSGHYADLNTRVDQLGAAINNHAALINAVTPGQAGSTLADSAVSPAVATSVPQQVMSFAIPDHATQTLAFEMPCKLEIIDVTVIKTAAGAGNTIQLTDATPNNITDAIAAAVDGAKTSCASLFSAYSTLAAGATLNIVATRAAGSMACQVLVRYVPRA